MGFDLKDCSVFTYWEGVKHPFTDLCLSSISKVFGQRHAHITDSTVSNWIDVPQSVLHSKHMIFRSDYIRTKLLEKYGGWWFDSDVLLWKDPGDLVRGDIPSIWNLVYFWEGRWQPLINCGILYTPPNSSWICRVSSDFDSVDASAFDEITLENEDIGQQIFELHTYSCSDVHVGHEHIFNSTVNVNADFAPFIDGTIMLETASHGLHVGASLSRWAAASGDLKARLLLASEDLTVILEEFPQSVYAQYYNKYVRGRSRG